jgi:signal transduction histidine kinase
LVTAADEARRGIERDLHDGAQQRLTAVAIGLGRLHARAEREQSADAAALGDVRKDLADARVELRRLAHGLYPSSLAVHGLEMAVRSEADRFDRRIRVQSRIEADVALPIQTAIYFCCLEAIQNAVVHAGETATIEVELFQPDAATVGFRVRDDGRGFDPAALDGAGHGFQNMRDRIGAFGGRLEIESAAGAGTTVTGHLPLDP